MHRSLLYQLYPLYAVAILVAVATLILAASHLFREAFYAEKEAELTNSVTLVVNALGAESLEGRTDAQSLVTALIRGTTNRLTLIAGDGTVLADSDADPPTMENHLERPEVRGALADGFGTDVRISATTGENSMYVATLVRDETGSPVAVARIAASITRIDARSQDVIRVLVIAGAIVVATTALFAGLVIARVHRPLRAIRTGADRYAGGDLRHRITVGRAPAEVLQIAETLNAMAGQLSETIGRITTQRNELEAVLGAMVEGVIVVAGDRTIRSLNEAAAGMFGVSRTEIDRHATILGTLRNTELDAIAEEVMATGHPVEATITLYRKHAISLQVHGTALASDSDSGVLLVLNDITRLKRLEDVRRDFVANVSHELKTPITTILGFVETLREGALHEPESAERFLAIAHSNAERLSLIVEDLLSLSRLESLETEAPVEECTIRDIVDKAVESCIRSAEQNRITVERGHSGPAGVNVNRTLVEQALINLVNNAIKFSPEGSVVRIDTVVRGDELTIAVKDHGYGIPRRDLPRIFERFYRVDQARSRALGGTGLGLAIVKHIAIAHRGEVTVESVEGRGSTFTLRIPGGKPDAE